jgi:DnaJ-class molecular chaperone
MDKTFIDYYALLGVDSHASEGTIKTAFKKLALQYHPDVYKGADAEERMRLLLLAYQTLSDPDERKTYDAQRSNHLFDNASGLHLAGTQHSYHTEEATSASSRAGQNAAKSSTGQHHFAFPDLSEPLPSTTYIDLDGIYYNLSPAEAATLRQEGLLRGDDRTKSNRAANYCHRCHHHWSNTATGNRSSNEYTTCPSCKANDWSQYLLLRCVHCSAVFESEEIHDKIIGQGHLYQPYELYPLCPHCRRSQWCPAENTRVDTLRAASARRTAILWMSVLIISLLIIGIFAIMIR